MQRVCGEVVDDGVVPGPGQQWGEWQCGHAETTKIKCISATMRWSTTADTAAGVAGRGNSGVAAGWTIKVIENCYTEILVILYIK